MTITTDPSKTKFKRLWFAIFLMGVINNNGYNFVLIAAQDLAKQFDKTDEMALFSVLLLFACFIATLSNAKFGLRFTFKQRMTIMLTVQSISYILFSISNYLEPNIGFIIALISSALCGACQAIGEVNSLSRLHILPPSLVGAWGSGTGASQLISPFFYMGLLQTGMNRGIIVLIMTIFNPIYYICFIYVNRRAETVRNLISREASIENGLKSTPMDSQMFFSSKKLSFENFKIVFRIANYIIVNLVTVYFLEYLINTSFLDRSTIHTEDFTSWISQNAYFMGMIGYGIGVFLSRTSVTFIQIPRVEIMTILQSINAILWCIEVYAQWLRTNNGFWYMFLWSIWVGLMGGASYGNCQYLIHNSTTIPNDLRELTVNSSIAAVNIGTMLANVLGLVLSSTVMQECSIYNCH